MMVVLWNALASPGVTGQTYPPPTISWCVVRPSQSIPSVHLACHTTPPNVILGNYKIYCKPKFQLFVHFSIYLNQLAGCVCFACYTGPGKDGEDSWPGPRFVFLWNFMLTGPNKYSHCNLRLRPSNIT